MSKNILGIFDAGDMQSITTLIEKLEESSFDYLRLEGDGIKVVIGKNGVVETGETSVPQAAAPAPVPAAAPAAAPQIESVPQPTASAEATPAAPAAAPAAEEEGLFVVKSPSYGLFYAQSEPGASPYVTVGVKVNAGDTMGLVEIMKTFTAITAEVSGTVAQIHVKNEQMLEPDQPLFSIQVS